MHKLRYKEVDDVRAEVVNDSAISYDEQSCVSHLQSMDSEACHACGRDERSMSCHYSKVVASQLVNKRALLSRRSNITQSGFFSVDFSFVLAGTDQSQVLLLLGLLP